MEMAIRAGVVPGHLAVSTAVKAWREAAGEVWKILAGLLPQCGAEPPGAAPVEALEQTVSAWMAIDYILTSRTLISDGEIVSNFILLMP